MSVRPGRSAILSYEDRPYTVAARAEQAMKLLNGTANRDRLSDRVKVVPMRGRPLFGVSGAEHALTRPEPLGDWRPAFEAVREHETDLLILDPALSAYVADPNATQFVRLFLDALYAEAEAGGFGVLLIAHSSKAGHRSGPHRDETGAVSGAAGSTDAARGVFTFEFEPSKKGEKEDTETKRKRLRRRILNCAKANYSRRFEVTLREHYDGDRFAGFEVEQPSAATVTGVDPDA